MLYSDSFNSYIWGYADLPVTQDTNHHFPSTNSCDDNACVLDISVNQNRWSPTETRNKADEK